MVEGTFWLFTVFTQGLPGIEGHPGAGGLLGEDVRYSPSVVVASCAHFSNKSIQLPFVCWHHLLGHNL